MKWNAKGFILVVFLTIIIASIITIRVLTTDMPLVDAWSSPFVGEVQGTTFYLVFRWITELGSGTFVTPFILIFSVIYCFFSKNILASVMIPLGTLLGYRANHWIKVLVERERPSLLPEAEGVGFSFPSGHAMGGFITYSLVIYFLSLYLKNNHTKLVVQIAGVTLILLIGMSRYVIQVHYLTDVIAGYAFGFLFLVCWIGLYNIINKAISTYD